MKQVSRFLPARSNAPLKTIAVSPDGAADASGVKRLGTSLSIAIATVHSPVARRIRYSIL